MNIKGKIRNIESIIYWIKTKKSPSVYLSDSASTITLKPNELSNPFPVDSTIALRNDYFDVSSGDERDFNMMADDKIKQLYDIAEHSSSDSVDTVAYIKESRKRRHNSKFGRGRRRLFRQKANSRKNNNRSFNKGKDSDGSCSESSKMPDLNIDGNESKNKKIMNEILSDNCPENSSPKIVENDKEITLISSSEICEIDVLGSSDEDHFVYKMTPSKHISSAGSDIFEKTMLTSSDSLLDADSDYEDIATYNCFLYPPDKNIENRLTFEEIFKDILEHIKEDRQKCNILKYIEDVSNISVDFEKELENIKIVVNENNIREISLLTIEDVKAYKESLRNINNTVS